MHTLAFTCKTDPLLSEKPTTKSCKKIQLNWYPIMVRPSDFIKESSKNQILQKTIYVYGEELSLFVKDIIKKQNISIRQAHSLLEKYLQVRIHLQDPNKWFSKNCFPLVYLRLLSLISDDPKSTLDKMLCLSQHFTDFLGKSKFKIPKDHSFVFRKNLCYLAGCSAGDGHISRDSRRWTLVDGSPYEDKLYLSKWFIEDLSKILAEYVNHSRFKKIGRKFDLVVNNKPFCRFLNSIYALPLGPKKDQLLRRPKIFDLAPREIKDTCISSFWRGCFDTDGFVSTCGHVSLSSINRSLLLDAQKDFADFGINAKIIKTDLIVPVKEIDSFAKIGFAHPRKQEVFVSLLRSGSTYKVFQGPNLDRIKNDILDPKIISKILSKPQITKVNLPGKLSQKLLHLVSFLRPWEHRVRVSMYSQESINFEQIREEVKNVFGANLIMKKTPLIYSKAICEYLEMFFIFAPPWRALGDGEIESFRQYWNVI